MAWQQVILLVLFAMNIGIILSEGADSKKEINDVIVGILVNGAMAGLVISL